MTISSAIEITDLKASYAGKEVLHGLDLFIPHGETYGIIGLNGAGKTTLIKIILGLKNQDFGDVSISGLGRLDPQTRSVISYLPERFDPPWFLKGDEFIQFSASLYGRKVAHEHMRSLAVELALDPDALKRRVQTYSKGMRQKLGLIATILTDCPVLLLDEPMSGLDPLARSKVRKTLIDLKAKGKTVILSSHILSDMDEICDQVAVIHDGIVEYQGTPDGFKQKMGEANLEHAFLKIVSADAA